MPHLILIILIHFFILTTAYAKHSVLRINVANSSYETGLILTLLEDFQKIHPETAVKVVHKGALQVLEDLRQGKSDFVLTHFPSSEKILVDAKLTSSRTLIMYNEFAIAGPKDDFLELRQQNDMNTVLHLLADNAVDFLIPHFSSGTSNKLKQLFTIANITPNWEGIKATGQSSKATLIAADKSESFSFIDVGTFLVNKDNLSGNIALLFRDNISLRNYYHAIIPNPEVYPKTNLFAAKKFLQYLVSERGQKIIAQFGDKQYVQHIYTAAAHLDPNIIMARLKQQSEYRDLKVLFIGGSIFIVILVALITIALRYRFQMMRAKLESMQHIKDLNNELELYNKNLVEISTTDFLTNISNRRYFFEMGEKYVELADRNNQSISLLIIDVDFFKKINDSYGHPVGDEVLIHMTSCITELLRKSDLFGRIGGEEFAVLLNDSNIHLAEKIAEKLRLNIANAFYKHNGIKISFTISIGCTELSLKLDSLLSMYAAADQNLFLAKKQGRNCVVAL
ncbi:MAG: diguanylate cyclase [Pseudomonadota bacterium]